MLQKAIICWREMFFPFFQQMILSVDYGCHNVCISKWEDASDYTINRTGACEIIPFDCKANCVR